MTNYAALIGGKVVKFNIRMVRPKYESIIAGVVGALVCPCGQKLNTFEQTREHWQMGHFDYPDDSLQRAAKKFVSEEMLNHLAGFADDTPLSLEVSGRNGFGIMMCLADLRRLAEALANV